MDRQKIPVTREGLERAKMELEELTNVKRPQIVAAVAEARSHGDLRENAGYEAARHDQAMNEKRISDLQAMLRHVELVEDQPIDNSGVIRVGATVVIEYDGEEERYTIVGAIEAKPAAGRISNQSPIGQALLGRRPGDVVKVPTPVGDHEVRILRLE